MSVLDKLLRRNRGTEKCNTEQRNDEKHVEDVETPSVEMSGAVETISGPVHKSTARTSVSMVRRNTDPPPVSNMEVVEIYAISDDIDTIIIQYADRGMLGGIKSTIRSKYMKTGESFIPPFIEVDIFANISLNPYHVPTDRYRGKKWLRVTYECIEDNHNPSAKTRFPQSLVIVINRTLNTPKLTIDTLLEGGGR